ncbi:TetR family transcriptional regulator [Stackebrandtia endophytica]|uniref:TetR family transcriptional regulator n=1 Tax=Stackebrandtia endophytica TaxID=1496996 RepID=A0A543B3I8_9ACTN|nr:TetR/AcrR family transcriptional regulator C-terminal domain-containing protein [Stackebrandtia endophytica]TQL79362.1 TetR family transcriptional regulator [Stackebrandtia endophytica]
MTAKRTRGQSAGISREEILAAAIRLVDRDGLAALSMRRLGAELGVQAMTLYHHVPNKDALLDGVVERVVVEAEPTSFGDGLWRDSLRDYARSLLKALLVHSNAIPLVLSRPATTPANLSIMEECLESLCEQGFTVEQALDIVYSLVRFVVGHAAAEATARAHPTNETRAPVINPEDYPLLSKAADYGGSQARFEFALEAMLRGFAAILPDH